MRRVNPKKIGLEYDKEHFIRVEKYIRQIEMLFDTTANEAVKIVSSISPDITKPFRIDDFPEVKARFGRLMNKFSSNMLFVVKTATKSEWLRACEKNDEMVNLLSKLMKMDGRLKGRYNSRNLQALESFQQRKMSGLNLSDRVWNYTSQFRGEIEMALDLGLFDGRSAQDLSRDVRMYLKEPKMLFRRVADTRGRLHLSKRAKEYMPGGGVYRSSYKNALRMTRTEVNMAYRMSDHIRWQQLDFVVGYEVKRSNKVFSCDICESLKGRYPKSFLFLGWHPQCRCQVVSILATQQEFISYQKKVLAGKDVTLKSKNEIKKPPKNFSDWYLLHKEKVDSSPNPPYFIRENKHHLHSNQ
ncbi:MAG: hypothetical protein EOM36_09835 [Bacteroidia bacterium]|nr:hypothetical protein [Bacteroidia bacterium]